MFTSLSFRSYVIGDQNFSLTDAGIDVGSVAAIATSRVFITVNAGADTYVIHVFDKTASGFTLQNLAIYISGKSFTGICCNETGDVVHAVTTTDNETTVYSFKYNGSSWINTSSLLIDGSGGGGASIQCDSLGEFIVVERQESPFSYVTFVHYSSDTLSALTEFQSGINKTSGSCAISNNGEVAVHAVEDSIYVFKRSGLIWTAYQEVSIGAFSSNNKIALSPNGDLFCISPGLVVGSGTSVYKDNGTSFSQTGGILYPSSGQGYSVFVVKDSITYVYTFLYYSGVEYSPLVHSFDGSSWSIENLFSNGVATPLNTHPFGVDVNSNGFAVMTKSNGTAYFYMIG